MSLAGRKLRSGADAEEDEWRQEVSHRSANACSNFPAGAGPNWRMGFAGDTFNTLWALRALTGDAPADYVSAFGDDPFSHDQIAFFAENGIGIGASPLIPGARPGLYAITLTGAERSSPTGAPMRRPDGLLRSGRLGKKP